MAKILYTLFILILSFAFADLSRAVCVEGPPNVFTCNTNAPNPDLNGVQQGGNSNNLIVNVLPGAQINTVGQAIFQAIATDGGSDTVTITNGVINADNEGVSTGNDPDTVEVIGSTITSPGECVETGNADDVITVTNSTMTSDSQETIAAGNDNDNVTVTGSTLSSFGNPATISTGNGSDFLRVSSSTVNAAIETAIALLNENDTLALGTGAQINGLIDCGSDFDTVIFEMEVPTTSLTFLSAQISDLNNGLADSIVINGLLYSFEDCEIFENELVGVSVVSKVPTLSEWGLIAMASILGIVGFMFIRRIKVTA